ncbi:MAG: glutamate 5-kinase [Myxococcales bacterium]|nr:glutamate 5-kinase [Myxococcales bacterium]
MSDRPTHFGGARRVVIKIGSAVLRDGPEFDRVTFAALVRDLVGLTREGLEVICVCSGAVALGLSQLGVGRRPERLSELQATAAVGQGVLMRLWNDELSHYGRVAGQVLLTHDDLRHRGRFLAARHTLQALLALGAVPVINENDTVAVDEIKLGDNDMLSSQIVSLVGAGLLVILSDVQGLYDRDPREPGAALIHHVPRIDADLLQGTGGSSSGLGSGGMRTKVLAVQQVNRLGVPGIIAPGKSPRVLRRLFEGEAVGTWFAPEPDTMGSRKHWIAYASKPSGRLVVDAGARAALCARGRSLLPVGLKGVEGDFDTGDVVEVADEAGEIFARGLACHPADALRAAQGGHLSADAPEAIHRDDLVLLAAP